MQDTIRIAVVRPSFTEAESWAVSNALWALLRTMQADYATAIERHQTDKADLLRRQIAATRTAAIALSDASIAAGIR